MKKSFLFIYLFLITLLSKGQNCNCTENFSFLVTTIENDYSGFNDKVNEITRDKYNEWTASYRQRVKETNSTFRCTMLLNKWLEFFNDNHLSIEVTKNIYWTFKKIDSTTLLLRIPSFSWESKRIIDSLVNTNLKLITSTPILIIDLRGNGGGIDYSFQSLLPLIFTNPYESKGVAWRSSEGNIRFFEDAVKKGEIRKGAEEETKILIEELKKHPDSFVTVDKSGTVSEDTTYKMPIKVGVIVNDYCASSCEQFILSAKNSSKTIVFGTNTMGVLDYSNSISVPMPTKNVQLRYPMTRSNRLPEFPIDNIGITPDVRITLPDNLDIKGQVDEWVIFVKEYLTRELKK